MLRTILVAFDGSDRSRKAFDLGLEIALTTDGSWPVGADCGTILFFGAAKIIECGIQEREGIMREDHNISRRELVAGTLNAMVGGIGLVLLDGCDNGGNRLNAGSNMFIPVRSFFPPT